MLGAVTLVAMAVAAVTLALAILLLILRMTISTSISSNRPPRRDAPRLTQIGSRLSKQK